MKLEVGDWWPTGPLLIKWSGGARTDFVFFVIRELGRGRNYRGRVAISPIYVLSLSPFPTCSNIFFLLSRLRKLTALS